MDPLLLLSFILLGALIGLAVLHHFFPSWRGTIIFFGSGIGVVAAICSVAQVAYQNSQAVAQQRRGVAFYYAERWEELPTLKAAQALKGIEGKTGREIAEIFMDDLDGQECLLRVMNFFERIGLTAKVDYSDEVSLCEVFRGQAVQYYSNLEEYIRHYRRLNSQPGAWENFEWLYNRWKKSCPV